MSGHKYSRMEYTVIDILGEGEKAERQWCYSAKNLQQTFQSLFCGKKIKALFIELQGYLEGNLREGKLFSLLCDGDTYFAIFSESALELQIAATGQIKYRIIPIDEIRMRKTKDFPPGEYEKLRKCFVDTNIIKNEIVNSICVFGTDERIFAFPDFDEAKAEESAKKADLPKQINISTDLHRIDLIGADFDFSEITIENNY